MSKIKPLPLLEDARKWRDEIERNTRTNFNFGGDYAMIPTDISALNDADLVKLFQQMHKMK